MSAEPAVTMQDLELEHAELLPGRETLNGGFSQEGYGNTAQNGFLNFSFGNGDFNNIASVGSGNVV